jgi:hypothetical protein
MLPISQSVAPLLGYASPIEQPYQEEEVPLGLLAFVAKQQEEAQNQQAQVVQSPTANALDGIGGLPSDELFNVTGKDLAKGMRGMFGGGKLGTIIDTMIASGSANVTLGPGGVITRDAPIPEGARKLLERSDPARLRRMDAFQKFDAANKEET